MKIVVFTQVQTNQQGKYYFFFEVKGSRQLELLLVEAANGVTPAIQGLNIQNSREGYLPPGFQEGYLPPGFQGGGEITPITPLMAATDFCVCKRVPFLAKSKDYTQGRGIFYISGSSYIKSFKSSLQSHPLWITLYINN